MPGVKAAAKRFSRLEPRDQVTLLGFNENIFTLARRSTDQAVRAARSIGSPRGGGPRSMTSSSTRRSPRPQSGRRSIVLFSDGDDQNSHAPLDTAIARTREATRRSTQSARGAPSIRGPSEAAPAARRRERWTGVLRDDPSRLDTIFTEILEDIRNQYLLAYPAPENARDGVWHKIQVRAAGGSITSGLARAIAHRRP